VTFTIREVTPSGYTAPNGSSISSAFTWGQTPNANFALATPFSTTYTGNAFTLRLNSAGTQEQIFTASSATGIPTYAATVGSFSSLAFTGSGASDSLDIDLTNGNPIPTGGVNFTGSGSGSNVVVTGSANNDSVSASNQSITIGATSATFNNVSTINLNLGGGDDTITDNVTSPTFAFAGGSGNDTLNVNAGAVAFDHDAQSDTASLAINVASGASVSFSATQHLAALNLNGGSASVSGANHVLVTSALSITGNGKLDLGGNSMVLASSDPNALANATALLIAGRNGGSWNGAGIITSLPGAQTMIHTLGIASASDALGITGSQLAQWQGQTVGASAVLVRYTIAGDANLDGAITGDDYFRIDSAFTSHASGYANGDFNYSGHIDADDYFIIDSNYNKV